MKDFILTFAFLLFAFFMVFIRFLLPSFILVLGLRKTRNNEKYGKLVLILGTIYLFASVIIFIFSMFRYGF